MENILLSVSSPPELDIELFTMWTEGCSVEEAEHYKLDQMRKQFHQHQHSSLGKNENNKSSMTVLGLEFPRALENYLLDFTGIVQYEMLDQFRSFQTLEHYLMQPHLLRIQSLCIVPHELQSWIIEKYWSLDDFFVREILNKRLVKSRKDLEDIAEGTNLNLRRITRQLDNIKRIFSTFEDSPTVVGNIYNIIAKSYLLSHSLCKRYACIIFLLYSKFNITSKRRMQKIPCEK
jgi:hypothetical protein